MEDNIVARVEGMWNMLDKILQQLVEIDDRVSALENKNDLDDQYAMEQNERG